MQAETVVSDDDTVKDNPAWAYLQPEVPQWARRMIIALQFGNGRILPGAPGECAWCRSRDDVEPILNRTQTAAVRYKGKSILLCGPCAQRFGYRAASFTPRCRKCHLPMDRLPTFALWSVWTSPSVADSQICSTCFFGAPNLIDADLVRAILDHGRDDLIAEAQIHLNAGMTTESTVIQVADLAFYTDALFEALRLHHVSADALVETVPAFAREIVEGPVN